MRKERKKERKTERKKVDKILCSSVARLRMIIQSPLYSKYVHMILHCAIFIYK